jgi:hypothetical protein
LETSNEEISLSEVSAISDWDNDLEEYSLDRWDTPTPEQNEIKDKDFGE